MFDTNSINERCMAFDEAHGGRESILAEEGMFYFPDGASREAHPVGFWYDPPSDDFKRAKMIEYYWRRKLGLAVEQFQTKKQYLAQMASANSKSATASPPPPQCEIDRLLELRKKVLKFKVKHDEAKAAVTETEPEKLKERRERNAQHREANSSFLSELNNIEI